MSDDKAKAKDAVIRAAREYFTANEICRLANADEDDRFRAIMAAGDLHDALKNLDSLGDGA